MKKEIPYLISLKDPSTETLSTQLLPFAKMEIKGKQNKTEINHLLQKSHEDIKMHDWLHLPNSKHAETGNSTNAISYIDIKACSYLLRGRNWVHFAHRL